MQERFAFGENWQEYLRKNFSEERVAVACAVPRTASICLKDE